MRLTHRALLAVVAALALAAVAGAAMLWPSPPEPVAGAEDAVGEETFDATITEVRVVDEDLAEAILLDDATLVEIVAELDATGEEVVFETTDETGGTYRAGQGVELAHIETEGEGTWYVSDFQRGGALLALSAMFVLAVLAFGRWQGARALLGLALTLVVIVAFIVPAILDGSSPVAVALVGAVAVMIATLYLAHGASAKTTAAVVGTAGALLLTAGLAALFSELATLTGWTSEDARMANVEVGGLSLQGLLLAGIIIGGLGVLDDVTMSQSATVFALRRADPRAGFARLFGEALSVGRDHVAATVNTLFLAYAGASLPLLILFTTTQAPLGDVLTAEIVAVEIVRTLVGSLGLIAAVPLTTALAAAVALERAPGAEPADAHGLAHGPGASTTPPRSPGTAAAAAAPGAATGADVDGPGGSPGHGAGQEPSRRGEPAPGRSEADADGPVLPDEPDDDEAWVQRLRSAYRLPPHDR